MKHLTVHYERGKLLCRCCCSIRAVFSPAKVLIWGLGRGGGGGCVEYIHLVCTELWCCLKPSVPSLWDSEEGIQSRGLKFDAGVWRGKSVFVNTSSAGWNGG